MKIAKSKTLAIAITIFFVLSMTASMALIPNANAHSPPWKIQTYAFINVAPNPAGVDQTVNVGVWLNQPPPTADAQYGDRWQNFKVTITLPDGTTTTLGPLTSDATGGTHADYTPTKAGNYTFVFTFPGQTLAGNNLIPGVPAFVYPNIGDYYEPSNASATLTVQQTATPAIPQTALPTNYWTRPIESVNDLWYSISGNWLGLAGSTFANTGMYNATGNYNPYTTAPTTSHILWTKPAAPGGLIGGEFGATDTSNFYAPAQYEPKFAPIIMNGILYYEMFPGSSVNPTGWAALDLKTGQTLWTKNNTIGAMENSMGAQTPILLCGQILDYVSPDQYGGFTYLWATGDPFGSDTLSGTLFNPSTQTYVPTTTSLVGGTTYSMYDAVTGDYILSVVNCSALTLVEDPHGDLIGYFVNYNNPTPMLGMWNSTTAIFANQQMNMFATLWTWRPPQGGIIPFSSGIQWTVPIATNISGVPLPSPLFMSSSDIDDNVILMTAAVSGGGMAFQGGYQIEAGYSATTGAQVWITNRTETPYTIVDTTPATAGVYAEINQATGIINGYSMATGKPVWGPITLSPMNPYNSIGEYQATVANGVIYLYGFGGDIYAINATTGAYIWTTTTNQLSGPAGSNTPYGVWPLWTFTVSSVAGGILFLPEGHQYSPPMFRGANQLAINCTNGKLVWSIMGFDVTSGPAISDGVMIAFSSYDNQIYSYGMGPSKTTVTAPDIGVTTATPVTITGTVMDISAGSQQNAVAANFPNGLPCVSDASMSQFMEAVYEQQPMPTNITGVPVTLSVTDSNHNTYDIGTTTTNAMGTYGLTWTPIVPGNYTLTATFGGTAAYYGSSAATYFYAGTPAPSASPYPSPVSGVASTGTVELGVAALAIVIVVCVAVLAVLMLRKRP